MSGTLRWTGWAGAGRYMGTVLRSSVFLALFPEVNGNAAQENRERDEEERGGNRGEVGDGLRQRIHQRTWRCMRCPGRNRTASTGGKGPSPCMVWKDEHHSLSPARRKRRALRPEQHQLSPHSGPGYDARGREAGVRGGHWGGPTKGGCLSRTPRSGVRVAGGGYR